MRNMEIVSPGGKRTVMSIPANINPGLIAGDGDVHIIYKEESVWPLRSFIAKNLVGLMSDEFLIERMTYKEDLSNDDFKVN